MLRVKFSNDFSWSALANLIKKKIRSTTAMDYPSMDQLSIWIIVLDWNSMRKRGRGQSIWGKKNSLTNFIIFFFLSFSEGRRWRWSEALVRSAAFSFKISISSLKILSSTGPRMKLTTEIEHSHRWIFYFISFCLVTSIIELRTLVMKQ